jgi:hypothetical protein
MNVSTSCAGLGLALSECLLARALACFRRGLFARAGWRPSGDAFSPGGRTIVASDFQSLVHAASISLPARRADGGCHTRRLRPELRLIDFKTAFLAPLRRQGIEFNGKRDPRVSIVRPPGGERRRDRVGTARIPGARSPWQPTMRPPGDDRRLFGTTRHVPDRLHLTLLDAHAEYRASMQHPSRPRASDAGHGRRRAFTIAGVPTFGR